jgi:hypothetical protein
VTLTCSDAAIQVGSTPNSGTLQGNGICPEEDSIGGLCGDPHFFGAFGASFNFKGKANSDYAMFTTPHFALNIHTAGEGPDMHFITEAGVLFRNVSLTFTTITHSASFVANLNKQLAAVGGRATALSKYKTLLSFCDGDQVIVSQMVTLHEPKFYYLDLKVSAVGCSDSYGGILGQTYQCKYATGKEKFVFDTTSEDSFRIKSVVAQSGAFDSSAKCERVNTQVHNSGAEHNVAPATGGSK